jgi:hypothetical protein
MSTKTDRTAAALRAITTASDEALWLILDDPTAPDWKVLAAETEIDRRDYDASDPAAPRHAYQDARDSSVTS